MARGESYEEFVAKFEPKKTTDDCYTPPSIYEIVKKWTCEKYGIDPGKVVRPFYPGGDFENFDYSGGKVVIDNPPFSILTKICEFYLNVGVQFFLFCPGNTALSGKVIFDRTNHIITDCKITYENGAVVSTCFITNCGDETIAAETAPDLTRLINDEDQRLQKINKKVLPKYEYPEYVLTAAMLRKYAARGIDFKIPRSECVRISELDAQVEHGKAIFGSGLLVSERLAAERLAADQLAADQLAAGEVMVWKLSDREKEIVKLLSK